MANNLKNSLSPYLLQHKDNPVDWYEWGDEAFLKAKKENKLIFLSIGYSTCHWCHVMEHESFEDEEVAKLLNRYYISIKVDKEQMPHIDNFYQLGYRIVNKKSGGWPLTIILTPDMKPIFFGTYIPKYKGYGSNGLLNILNFFAHYDRKELQKSGEEIERVIKKYQNIKQPTQKLDRKIELKTIEGFKKIYDFKNFGFSISPKFPQAVSIKLLLDLYLLTENRDALSMAINMLKAIAKGGIYDQIDGAFYRYSVDAKWEIPHFEKMLYTNAELLTTYALAYKITKNPLFKRVIDRTIREIDRRFLVDGVYFSASDADSKNRDGKKEEGYFFIYQYDETLDYLIKNGIDKKEAKEALHHFGIEENGNFDGEYSNPHIVDNKKIDSKIKKLLSKMREKREYPFIDKKINLAWNALYIKALFETGYRDRAEKSLNALLKLLYRDGILYHQTLLPHKATQEGLLEDYAFLSDALFEAYQVTLNEKYITLFEKITYKSVELFYKNSKWRESNDEFETYANIEDNNYKSSLGTNLENLLKLSAIKGDFKLNSIVKKTIDSYSSILNRVPHYYPTAIRVVLMLKDNIYFIKGEKEELLKLNIDKLNYPFIYKEAINQKNYLICGISNCFKITKTPQEALEELKKLIENR